jgi:hypothetical protein
MIKKILKNQTGMSLLEVTIAGAIAVGIGLGTVKLVENANKGAVKVKTDTEIGELRNFIKTNFTRGNNCANTFNSQTDFGITDIPINAADGSGGLNSGSGLTHPYVDPLPQFYSLRAQYTSNSNNHTFTIVTTTTGDGVDLTIDERIEGYPNWIVDDVKIFKLSNTAADGDTNTGVCPVHISVVRDSGLNSQRTLGANTKGFWINLNCSVTPGAAATQRVSYCIENQAVVPGFWVLQNDTTPTDGIKYNYNVDIGVAGTNADLKIIQGNIDIESGDIYVGGDVQITSDKRLKEKEEVISNATQKLDEMSGYYYFLRQDILEDRKLSKRKQVGVMAQEVEKVFPEAVKTKEDGYKSVNYMKLIPLLIQAHKEQEEKIKLQQKHILILSRKINELEQRK